MKKPKSSAAKAAQAATATTDDRKELQPVSQPAEAAAGGDARTATIVSNTEGAAPVSARPLPPNPVAEETEVGKAGGQGEPPATNSTDNPRAKSDGGAGNPAGPAQDAASEVKTIPEDDPFRREFPLLSAAIDAWRAANPEGWPSIIRITSKRDGFRRAGMVHSRTTADYPVETLNRPQLLEQLLAEPMLTVELI